LPVISDPSPWRVRDGNAHEALSALRAAGLCRAMSSIAWR
jgi:hypothetical protein